MTKLKAEKERQGLILERKKEEVQLNKQKLVELQQKMRGDHARDRPRSAASQNSTFQTSLRNGDEPGGARGRVSAPGRNGRAGSTQRKQHRLRQQKVRKLAKQLVSAASRRSGLKETVKRERSTRDAAVQNLERLYEAKMDTDDPDLDDEILRYEEEIDAKNQTIAAMHDAMNDEDLSDTTSLLATLPVEDHGDLITILVEIAARDPGARGVLDELDDVTAVVAPGKKVTRKKGRRPRTSSTPRRNSTGSREGAGDDVDVAPLDGDDSVEDGGSVTEIGGGLPVRVPDGSGDFEPEPEPEGAISISQIPIPGTSRTSPAKPGRSRSPPTIPVPGLPPGRGSVGGGASVRSKKKAAAAAAADDDTSGHSVFDRLSEPGEKPKPVSHRDGIYVAATRREKSKSSDSGGGTASRRSFQFQTTLVGHRGAVYDAATNESCTKVYSASQDTTVLEWDVETSQITAVCEGHQGFVRAVVVASGDGEGGGALGDVAGGSPELALSGAQDSCIKLWDMRAPHSSRCVATLTEHSAEVCFLSVVGDKLFSGSADATVKYWDIRQRKCVDTLRGHKSTVFAVAAACKPGETAPCMYFTGSRDHTIKVWDASFRCRQTIQAHTDSVTSLVVCGEHLFSSSRENRIKKWHIDLDDVEGVPVTKVKSFRAHNDWVCGGSPQYLSRHPSRRVHSPCSLCVWSLIVFAAMALQNGSAGSSALLSASRDGSVRVWDSAVSLVFSSAPRIRRAALLLVLLPLGRNAHTWAR